MLTYRSFAAPTGPVTARVGRENLAGEGIAALTTLVENFLGPELVANIKRQAQRFGAEYRVGQVTDADLSRRPFRITIDSQEMVETRTLIVATGASARWLGLDSEQRLIGRGVSSCATCDGFFYRGRPVMVVGGGDSAMEEAIFLTKFASEVTICHRRDQFRASKIMLERARGNEKIRWLTDTVVDEVYDVARNEVTGVRLWNVKSNRRWDQRVDGLFVAIGHAPNTQVFRGQLELDPDGYIVSKGGARTNIPGVFHAGDVQDRHYRRAVTAAVMGCMAAIEAERSWGCSACGPVDH
jgi:thioredoxin reductase (NADPH)